MVELTRAHMRAVHQIRARYFPHIADLLVDDLLSAGMEGLVHAAKSYDATRGTTFSSHAHRRIHGAMQDYLRSANGRGVRGTRSYPILVGDWVSFERGAARYEPISEYELNDSIETAIDTLPAQWQYVMRGVYLHERTMGEVGAELGVSTSRVCQIAGEARERLRVLLDQEALAA